MSSDGASKEWDRAVKKVSDLIVGLPSSCPKCGELVSQWTHKPTGNPLPCTTNLVVPENQTPDKL